MDPPVVGGLRGCSEKGGLKGLPKVANHYCLSPDIKGLKRGKTCIFMLVLLLFFRIFRMDDSFSILFVEFARTKKCEFK